MSRCVVPALSARYKLHSRQLHPRSLASVRSHQTAHVPSHTAHAHEVDEGSLRGNGRETCLRDDATSRIPRRKLQLFREPWLALPPRRCTSHVQAWNLASGEEEVMRIANRRWIGINCRLSRTHNAGHKCEEYFSCYRSSCQIAL